MTSIIPCIRLVVITGWIISACLIVAGTGCAGSGRNASWHVQDSTTMPVEYFYIESEKKPYHAHPSWICVWFNGLYRMDSLTVARLADSLGMYVLSTDEIREGSWQWDRRGAAWDHRIQQDGYWILAKKDRSRFARFHCMELQALRVDHRVIMAGPVIVVNPSRVILYGNHITITPGSRRERDEHFWDKLKEEGVERIRLRYGPDFYEVTLAPDVGEGMWEILERLKTEGYLNYVNIIDNELGVDQ